MYMCKRERERDKGDIPLPSPSLTAGSLDHFVVFEIESGDKVSSDVVKQVHILGQSDLYSFTTAGKTLSKKRIANISF